MRALMCPTPAISHTLKQTGPAAERSLVALPEIWMMQLGLAHCWCVRLEHTQLVGAFLFFFFVKYTLLLLFCAGEGGC